jgi:hypothetical protein
VLNTSLASSFGSKNQTDQQREQWLHVKPQQNKETGTLATSLDPCSPDARVHVHTPAPQNQYNDNQLIKHSADTLLNKQLGIVWRCCPPSKITT